MDTRRDAADTVESDHGAPDATAAWPIVVGVAITVIHLASVVLLGALRSPGLIGGYVVYVLAAQAVLWSVALAATKPFTRPAWLRRAVYSSLAAGAVMTWVTMLTPMAMADVRDGTRWVEGTAMWTGWPTQAVALVPLAIAAIRLVNGKARSRSVGRLAMVGTILGSTGLLWMTWLMVYATA